MKIPTEVRLCWDFFLGGALVSSAPTEQALHQPSKHCTNRASTAPTELTIRGYVGVRGGCVKTKIFGKLNSKRF